MKSLFCSILKQNSHKFDYKFDWEDWVKSKEGLRSLCTLNSIKLVTETLKTPGYLSSIYDSYAENK